MRLFAVIPAGGKSARLGQPKLLLPWRGATLLQHVIGELRPVVQRTVVVTNPELPKLAKLAADADAFAVPLPEPTADMRATVQVGLDWLQRNERPSPDDGWFLLPGDSPGVAVDLVRRLARAAEAHPENSIVAPTHSGRRGHPVLLRWRHVEAIRAWPAGQGIDGYIRSRADETLEFPTENAGVLDDLDTVADYRRFTKALP